MNRFGLREDIIEFIVDKAKDCGISEVIIFGSLARGDFSEKSDIDLAIYGSSLDGFKAALDENCPTLLTFDFIDLSKDISEDLRNRIAEEGVVLYGEIY